MQAYKGLLLTLTAGTLMLSGCNDENVKTLHQIDSDVDNEEPALVYEVNQLAATLDQAVNALEAQEQVQEWNRIKHWTIDLACLENTQVQQATLNSEEALMLPVSNQESADHESAENETETSDGPRVRLGAYYLQDGLEIRVRGASYGFEAEHAYPDDAQYQGVGFNQQESAIQGKIIKASAVKTEYEQPASNPRSRCYKF